MTLKTPAKQLTFIEFLEQLPDQDGRYELVNRNIMRILATRQHEDIADFIARQFDKEVERLHLNYRVSGRIMLRTLTVTGVEQGRQPDVSVVDKKIWQAYPNSYSALLEPIQLAVEIISTNWEDDYIDKRDEYQRLGIPEYWIVDYLAMGSRNYLGNPKVPTIFVNLLDKNGVYQTQAYQGTDRIISQTFPELELTVEQVWQAI